MKYYYFIDEDVTNVSVTLVGTYTVAPEWQLIYGVKSVSLDDAYDDSDIVEDDTVTTTFIGAAWTY